MANGKDEGWVPCGYLEPLHQELDNESISDGAVTDLGNNVTTITTITVIVVYGML